MSVGRKRVLHGYLKASVAFVFSAQGTLKIVPSEDSSILVHERFGDLGEVGKVVVFFCVLLRKKNRQSQLQQ